MSDFELHTNRDQREDGSRQVVDGDRPAPALTAKSGGQWVLRSSQTVAGGPRAERAQGEPSVTVTQNFDRAKWVSDRPAPTIVTSRRAGGGIVVGRRLPDGEGRNVGGWGWERPATTVCGDPRLGEPGHRDREGGEPQFRNDGVRITEREALILQSFAEDYPVQGSRSKRFEQIGNAVPPRLAMHLLASLLGVELQEDDAA